LADTAPTVARYSLVSKLLCVGVGVGVGAGTGDGVGVGAGAGAGAGVGIGVLATPPPPHAVVARKLVIAADCNNRTHAMFMTIS
jgi:hypothetical protein